MKETESVRNEDIMKQAADGRIQIHKKTDEEVISFGKKRSKKDKKKDKKKNQQQQVVEPEVIANENEVKLNLDILRAFAEVKVAAPTTPDELQSTIDRLTELEVEYEERGEAENDEGGQGTEKKEGGDKKKKPTRVAKFENFDEGNQEQWPEI